MYDILFVVADKPNNFVDRRQLRVQYERGVGECNEVISGATQQPRLPLYVLSYNYICYRIPSSTSKCTETTFTLSTRILSLEHIETLRRLKYVANKPNKRTSHLILINAKLK